MNRRAGGLALAALLAAPVGCVLFVEAPDGLGRTCGFAGRGTAACGACVADRCQAAVDACCSGSACRGGLGALDACADGGPCAPLGALAGPEGAALAACVAAACAGSCLGATAIAGDAGVAKVDGGAAAGADAGRARDARAPARTACFTGETGRACTCSVPDAGTGTNDDTCGPDTVPNAQCCADAGFPATGTRCSCNRIACTGDGGSGCLCGAGVSLELTCTVTPCCLLADGFTCRCRGFCLSGERSVASCTDPAVYACPTGQKAVARCDDR